MKFWPEILFNFLINFGKLSCLLPLDSGSTVTLKVLNGVGCFIVTANIIGVQLSMISTIYINFHKRLLVTNLLGIVISLFELVFNILFWRFKRVEFQELLQKFKTFLSESKVHERIIINKYFNRYKYFYTFYSIFAVGTIIIRVIFAPTQQPLKIPFAIYYPFAIKQYSATYYFIYLSQSITSFYCGYQMIFPITVAMILKHAAIKLEILIYDLRKVKNYNQLKIWIQQHLECIQFVNRINVVLGSAIMKSYIVIGLAIIFGSIGFIYNPDFLKIIRIFLMIISLLMGTYIYNEPANDIYEMNQKIGLTLYDMEWNEELIEMRKALIIIMNQVQKPIYISPLEGLMPALNRKIYSNFLSYLVSYIMTLRAIVNTQ